MNKRCISALLVLLMLAVSFVSCKNELPNDETIDTDAPPAEEGTSDSDKPLVIDVIKNSESGFSIVRPEISSDAITKSCTNLRANIKTLTKVTLEIKDDWYKEGIQPLDPNALEILIGETNRAETAEVLASLPENSYAVKITEKKIVIVGKDNSLTALALMEFENRILKDSEKCGEGMLTLSESDSFTVTLEEELTLKTILQKRYEIICTSKQVAHTPRRGDQRIGQGAASDGTYVYFVLRDSGDTGSVITKHRMDNGAFVAVSEILDLGHGNDMTYDAKNNRLVVAHGQSEGQILTLVDPETLAFIKDINIPKGSGAITYNEKYDRYAISQGGKTLYILDSNFKLVSSYSRNDSTGYTAQGMGSDDELIYFPMSGNNDNKLVAYDWNGKYVGTITIPVSHESESMFWVNGKYYIAYNTNGEALYETTFEICY